MKMFAQAVGWFVFLALITNFAASQSYFRLEGKHLTAQEGSCIEIKCIVTSRVDAKVAVHNAYWFWMKDGIWNNETYDATIVSSTDTTLRPVSPDFSGRVQYIGTPSSGWNSNDNTQKLCSVLICNLTKHDSGNYAFRFIEKGKEGKDGLKWKTNVVNLTVTENPCPITFQKPPPAVTSTRITLTCSTFSSCPSSLQIRDLTEQRSTLRSEPGQGDGKTKSTTVHFTVNSQDDGKVLSCQTRDNKDPYLIQNITVTVEYGPRDTLAKISSTFIKEGDSVTLTCSANGRPAPTFTWFQKEQNVSFLAEWTIPSIQVSQSGEYRCEANNKYGAEKSKPVTIDVLYAPQVEVNMTSPALVTQGDTITLTCNVKRSNPKPHTYNWFVNGSNAGLYTDQYIKRVEPDDRGSYTCRATNTAGTGTSQSLDIRVQYRPRKTRISTSGNNGNVKINSLLTFFCETDAYPEPKRYSWYRYKPKKRFDSSQWTSCTTETNRLTLNSVQRTDEACYMCNATNSIDTGEDSPQFCIKVLYPPTDIKLSLDDVVTEGQPLIISCTVESSPLSSLTLQRTFSGVNELLSTPNINRDSNRLKYTVTAASTHAGFYTCRAENTEGSVTSAHRKLLVQYRPKPVTVEALPSLTVNEGTWLKLECNAKSYPEATSFTWMKTTDWTREINKKTQTLQLESVDPSDRGEYSCAATNVIGTGRSEKVVIEVKYAPKHTKITQMPKQQQPDGRSSVELSCSSDGFPQVSDYSWYRKTKDGKQDVIVSHQQSHTVYSDQPGVYYCIAKNELNQRSSDPVELFRNRGFMTFLKFFFLVLICLLLVFVLVLVYRHRNKSAQQGRTNPQACFGFLGWWNCAKRRDLTNEPVIAEPFRSRDDLLREQPCRPQAQRRQPRPDSTPAHNINSVYCTVNLPAAQQGPSQKPIAQRGGHTVDETPNYASVHFGNKQKNKQPKAEENVVYAMVSKQQPANKNEPEKLVDYENVSAAHGAKSPHPLNYDTDTSEDDVDLNYSRVSFKAKAGHRRAGRDSSSDTSSDSSTSDEEETQYSEVKL
ncbi:B-cell receptor CD22 [Chaetodon trifascialis]|uniref:B-cell receptor CD22 n=1 Tax=Chaetodon trifascialis TaxID=109706 RepID=UPI00399380A5